MKKIWLVAIGVVLLLGTILLASCGTESSPSVSNYNSQQAGIWVSGEGKVTATPDVAILSLGIQAQETDVAPAQSEAAAAMDKVRTALKDAGIADKDIQTTYFSIQPVYQYDNNKQQSILSGYQVTNTVTVKVRKVDQTGPILDAVSAAGGNLIRVNNVAFTIDDPTPSYAQARVKAVADAIAKAKQLADNAGVKLGKLTYITESNNTPSPIYRTDMTSGAVAPATTTPISTGEIDIITDVQIAYAIGN
ncbi:MAG: SIMPL domain-containing protein [Dehalococcoidales bacterium]